MVEQFSINGLENKMTSLGKPVQKFADVFAPTRKTFSATEDTLKNFNAAIDTTREKLQGFCESISQGVVSPGQGDIAAGSQIEQTLNNLDATLGKLCEKLEKNTSTGSGPVVSFTKWLIQPILDLVKTQPESPGSVSDTGQTSQDPEKSIEQLHGLTDIDISSLEKQVSDQSKIIGDRSRALAILVENTKTANAAVMDFKDVTSAITPIMQAYGEKTGQATKNFGGMMLVAKTSTKKSFHELSKGIAGLVPQASNANMKKEDLWAGFSMLTAKTGSTDQAAKQMAALIEAIQTPTKALVDVAKEYGHGSPMAMLEANGLKGIASLINSQDDNSALFKDTDAQNAAATLFQDNGNALEQEVSRMADCLGEVKNNASESSQDIVDFIAAWKYFNELLDRTQEGLASALVPVLTGILEVIGEMLYWFNGLSQGTKKTIGTLLLAGAAILGIIIPLAALVGAITVLGGTTSLIIAGIILTMGLLSASWEYLGMIVGAVGDHFQDCWNDLKGIFDGLMEIFRAVFDSIWQAIRSLPKLVRGVGKLFSKETYKPTPVPRKTKNPVKDIEKAKAQNTANAVANGEKSSVDVSMAITSPKGMEVLMADLKKKGPANFNLATQTERGPAFGGA